KSRDLPAKCALCTGDHTANFRGCPSYKKCNKNVQIPPKISSNEVPGDHARQLPRKSYAAATKTVTSSMDSISNVLSEFISNFNSLIAPLINLLTKIVNKRFCP
ncbi:PRE C2HC domain-containing protein, partial [Aphis craccivora]